VFDFADQHRGSYSDSLNSVVCPFYCSYSGFQDELLWGASWIHTASENSSYLSYIQNNGHTLGADDDDYSFSWDDKRVGTKVLLSKYVTTSSFLLLTYSKYLKSYGGVAL
ncbi:hypothetical protein MKW94_028787, partial [Papaver nudicaule]|nr:hypothetical protein [Papaver nudicaule]